MVAKLSPLVLMKQNLFIFGILLCIFLAQIAPGIGGRGGLLYPEVTVKYGATCIIFFVSGLTLKAKDLKRATQMYKLHLYIQVFTFVFIPNFMQLLARVILLPFDLNEWIVKGLITVGCMPPPVSSAVMLTRSVGGNEAAAVFNSALGSFIGIFITPFLLLFHVGLSSTLPIVSTIIHLGYTVITPLIIGQVVQVFVKTSLLQMLPLSAIGQIALLLVIYASFCDMFLNKDFAIDAHHILITMFLVVLCQIILLYSSYQIAFSMGHPRKTFTAQDIIAIVFCSTHKSLTLGMPLLRTLYSGYSHLAQISLPLLVYHPVQIILGFLLVPLAQDWLKRNSKQSRLYSRP